jgi:hypothetical protein
LNDISVMLNMEILQEWTSLWINVCIIWHTLLLVVSTLIVRLSSNQLDFVKVNRISYLQNIRRDVGRTLNMHLGCCRLDLKSFANQLVCGT